MYLRKYKDESLQVSTNLQLTQAAHGLENPKSGDILGFTGYHPGSHFINLVTYGFPWYSISHVGILGEYNGELLLFESTTLTDLPCFIAKQPVQGVQAQQIGARLATYRGKIWHYPLFRSLYEHENRRLTAFLISKIGLPYDQIGAVRSGGIGWSWFESYMHESCLSSLFCSELCAAAHAELGLFVTDHASKWSPNRFCRTERRKSILLKPRRVK